MLTHLLITNYALIDHLEIDFKKGLTIITGETGAGKSIILGALSLILGERADLKVIRKAENKSVIEASFNIEAYNDMEHFFEQNDIEFFDNECILRREIASNGRSRAFINDTPVTLSVLRELTLRLVDIHSQHSNMLLADALYQLSIIDSVSGNDSIKADYSKQFSQYKKLKVEIEKLKAEYDRKIDEANSTARAIADDARAKANRLIDELEKLNISVGDYSAFRKYIEKLNVDCFLKTVEPIFTSE